VLSWLVIVLGGWGMTVWFPALEATGPWIAATAYIALLGIFVAVRFERGGWRSRHLLDA
jgi:hypothetical protein